MIGLASCALIVQNMFFYFVYVYVCIFTVFVSVYMCYDVLVLFHVLGLC